jgi:hypothetical protein
MMTSAIGKAATKATAIVEVNALSKFTSWRTLSTDMLLAPSRGIQNAVAGTASLLGHFVQKVESDGAQRWLTEF